MAVVNKKKVSGKNVEELNSRIVELIASETSGGQQ